jgi:ABC-2 type transport system ATP-binding protein
MPSPRSSDTDLDHDPALSIEGLTHSYGDRLALSDLTLRVQPGEVFAFLGPNGSGKTTLFRILSTLIPPASGRARMLGLDLVAERDLIRRRIAVVFQSPSLDKQLTARENLMHHGHLYGLRGDDLRNRIETRLNHFSLLDRADEPVLRFSGGMRRRVELAKAMITDPDLLLMDEPASGLDPAARAQMWRALDAARAQRPITILLTTHLMDEADRCDRLAILHQGKLIALGLPDELKSRIGGDVISLTSRDPAALGAAIRSAVGIEPTSVNGVLRIEHADGPRLVPRLFDAAPGLIDSVSIGKPTLQDVFIHMTGQAFTG